MEALIVVDLQNDFCPGGALAVADGDTIVDGINALAKNFEIVITTQDWHPQDHGSFASNHPGAKPYDLGILSGREQVLWPDHCVQGSYGAQFHPGLKAKAENFVKGTNPKADSYSGFFDDDGATTGLNEFLINKKVTKVYICGLATDYCVKFTALDAIKLGYITVVIEDLSKGVNINPGDTEMALKDLHKNGAEIAKMKKTTIDQI